MEHIYDMIVIGGGPGGYTAALYGARAGLDVIVLEKLSAGGQMALTMQIDNYPGFEEGIDGFTLGEKMQQSAERFGVRTELEEVLSLKLDGAVKNVITDSGEYKGRTVVFSTGANPRELGIPGERELVGQGVNYCASCDGMFYRGKTVAVIGGGNSAVTDAMILARIADKVFIVHRRDKLKADKVYYDALMKMENVEFIWDSAVTEFLKDEEGFHGIGVVNVKSQEASRLMCDGIFVSVGRSPETSLVTGALELDSSGYIIADESTRTNLPGVFAVGDVRTKALRQVVTAVADGAVAAHYAEGYLAENK